MVQQINVLFVIRPPMFWNLRGIRNLIQRLAFHLTNVYPIINVKIL